MLIVRPLSRCQLSVGARVCAYWSDKFTCLHPGVICQPSSDDNTDDDDDDDVDDNDKLYSVDFDDGDAGKIPLDYIRMLPADFPLQRTFALSFTPLSCLSLAAVTVRAVATDCIVFIRVFSLLAQ